jgi:hypothetical protein
VKRRKLIEEDCKGLSSLLRRRRKKDEVVQITHTPWDSTREEGVLRVRKRRGRVLFYFHFQWRGRRRGLTPTQLIDSLNGRGREDGEGDGGERAPLRETHRTGDFCGDLSLQKEKLPVEERMMEEGEKRRRGTILREKRKEEMVIDRGESGRDVELGDDQLIMGHPSSIEAIGH